MALNYDALMGWTAEAVVQAYTEKDVMLYALSLGLGEDPMASDQLRFVYEKGLNVFPTFPVVLGSPGPWHSQGDFRLTPQMMVHGEQGLVVHKSMPPKGTIRATTRVAEIIDKGEGKGALIYLERTIVDSQSGDLLAVSKGTVFARADGGFAATPGAARPVAAIPDRAPDASETFSTLPQLALLYRLNGDMNPLHADPAFAAKAKYPKPILHGMCTYGIAARAILNAFGDLGEVKELDARFSAPLFPGEAVIVQMWRNPEDIAYRVRPKDRDAVVLDNGRARLA